MKEFSGETLKSVNTVRHTLSIILAPGIYVKIPGIYVKISFCFIFKEIFFLIYFTVCVLSPGQQSELVLKFYKQK